MTGWRIGYTANRALAPVFTRWITNTDSCASQISQWAAVEAIQGPQDAAEAMRAKFLERRDLIVRLLNGLPGVTCKTPGGAFYAWPNVTEACRMTGCADSEEFRKRLLHEAGVAVLADIHFGRRVPGDGQHIRFSYAASNEMIERGIERVAAFIGKNQSLTMATTIDNNSVARDAIMDRVRKALRKSGDDGKARDARRALCRDACAWPAARCRARPDRAVRRARDPHGIDGRADRLARCRFRQRSRAYLDALELPAAIAEQKSHTGVCWPEFADLDWSGAGLSIEPRPTQGHDRLGITGCLCAIAETGTLVFIPGPQMPTATTLLPDTHVVVLRASDVVATMEDAFTRVRAAKSRMPRAINFISGPSRTGDIEQTIVLGAHGPYRVHVLLLDPSAIG